MPEPRRVRVEGSLFRSRVPPGAVYVGRAAPGLKASPYANPFRARTHGTAQAVALYRDWLLTTPGILDQARTELAGRDLACWCKLPSPGAPDICHGAVLLEIANPPAPRTANGEQP